MQHRTSKSAAKRALLETYFAVTQRSIRGEQATVSTAELSADLEVKADWLCAHLRRQEWLQQNEELGWFNGYYDEDGQRLEGEHPGGVRMTLAGQVFALMAGVATDDQARQIVRAADRYLYDPSVGGYRLNTDVAADAERLSMRLGRCFGFAYGHKENGSMFSHTAVMYANALYKRGLVQEGFAVLDGIYRHCQDFDRSLIYLGIPEYIEPGGRGMYTCLTGSASWYLLTLLTEAFGIRGREGDLVLEPKLVGQQFNIDGTCSVLTRFADRKLRIIYHNPELLTWGAYSIAGIRLNGAPLPGAGRSVLVPRSAISALAANDVHTLDVHLQSDIHIGRGDGARRSG